MVTGTLNLVKLCVGIESVEHLAEYRARMKAKGAPQPPRHITRMWPKREKELLEGGSLYWVIKGQIRARQRILRLEEVIGEDGIRRCAIVMDPEIIRTMPAPRRAFQGWRYLEAKDAPPDLPESRSAEPALPPDLANALADMGLR